MHKQQVISAPCAHSFKISVVEILSLDKDLRLDVQENTSKLRLRKLGTKASNGGPQDKYKEFDDLLQLKELVDHTCPKPTNSFRTWPLLKFQKRKLPSWAPMSSLRSEWSNAIHVIFDFLHIHTSTLELIFDFDVNCFRCSTSQHKQKHAIL